MLGIIFNIERFAIHDGPGIRTVVFLKGCPLRCIWCANPEGQKAEPEILFDERKCDECGLCIDACSLNSIKKVDEKILIDREICNVCGNCVNICKKYGTEALSIIGQWVSVQEVLSEVEKDRLFYENSGGGITLSGGEPLSQPRFVLELLKECKKELLHTAIETSGYAPTRIFRRILKFVDLVLLDIKHMDPRLHKRFTGVSNRLIMKNAMQLSDLKVPTILRIPIIPGYNTSQSNLEDTALFIDKLNVDEVNLLPYHTFGVSKYKMLGREYKLNRIKIPDNEYMTAIKKSLESKMTSNIQIRIGG